MPRTTSASTIKRYDRIKLLDARRAYRERCTRHSPTGAPSEDWMAWLEWMNEWLAVIDELIKTATRERREQLRRKQNEHERATN